MELKRVKLYNFSSYAGEAEFDFSTRGGKHIVLIGGSNGAGKTSLFTAIKLALYGPLCFRYQGKNAQYSARIKELMNHDAFTEPEVKTYVELEVTLPLRQYDSSFVIHREWHYSGHRVQESYWVRDSGGTLSARDRDYFQNYLFTVVPPNMFELFFFDGEEISDFFSDSAYSAYIKNAVLTLCGYDTFSLIKRFCDTYVGTESPDSAHGHLADQLSEKEAALDRLNADIGAAEAALRDLEQKKAAAVSETNDLEAKFKASGGLSKREQDELNDRIRRSDREKNEYSKLIRDYVENLMPFCITASLSEQIDEQLRREEAMGQYMASTRQLSVSMLKNAISTTGAVSPDQIDALSRRLYDSISSALCPEEDPDHFPFIHDLSNEQRKQVSALLVQLRRFDPQEIIRAIDAKKDAAARYEQASRQLRESLPSVDADTFFQKFSSLSNQVAEYSRSLAEAQERLGRLNADRPVLEKAVDSLRARIQAEAKNQTAYLYTSRVSSMMDALISDAVQEKFRQIEKLTLRMFHDITHKENFIDLLELDGSFHIRIYKRQAYTIGELYALMDNIGMDELQIRLGAAGMKLLSDRFGTASPRLLRKKMKACLADEAPGLYPAETLELYKRVELSQLSKGEKQVFLLSLYWAIIKSSGQSVPFIIDTPFARIDTEHRGQLARLFFPSVSDQVIILSTDEEVVDSCYDMIRHQVSHQYLLSNDEMTGHTSVCPGYFTKGGSL